MNEGLYYAIEDSDELSVSTELDEKKHFIRERILDFGFVSHMELVSLQTDTTSPTSQDVLRNALNELQDVHEIIRTHKTTDAQNVIVGYCFNPKR